MKKNLHLFIIACLFLMGRDMSTLVEAHGYLDKPVYQEIIIVDNTTIKDEDGTFYVFNSKEDRDNFILKLEGAPSLYACLPGDPGYPNCQDNPVVRTETEKINSYSTSRYECKNPLLPVWTAGPADMSLNITAEASFQVEGTGLSISVGQSSTFPVPKGKEGNIKYRTKFTVTVYQQWVIYADGSRVKDVQYKTITPVVGDGTFFAVYRNA